MKERINAHPGGKGTKALLAGICATFIWGLAPAFIRTLSEEVGVLLSSGITTTIGGLLLFVYKWKKTGLKAIYKVPLRYWILCGSSYIGFTLSSNLSVGFSLNREQVLVTGLVRLLWPLMTLVMAIPINKAKASPLFLLSSLCCLLGVAISNLGGSGLDFYGLMSNIGAAWLPLMLALVSSFCWGFYSNFLTKIIHDESLDFVSILMIVTGCIHLLLSIVLPQPAGFGFSIFVQFLFIVFVSNCLANIFWNMAMLSSQSLNVIVLANFLPVISTLLTALILGVRITVYLLAGSVLVVTGTILSKQFIKQEDSA